MENPAENQCPGCGLSLHVCECNNVEPMETKKEKSCFYCGGVGSVANHIPCTFCLGSGVQKVSSESPPEKPASPERKTAEEVLTVANKFKSYPRMDDEYILKERALKAMKSYAAQETSDRDKRIAELEAKAGKLVEALEKLAKGEKYSVEISRRALNEYRKP